MSADPLDQMRSWGGLLLRLARRPDGSRAVEVWNGSRWVAPAGDDGPYVSDWMAADWPNPRQPPPPAGVTRFQ